MPAVTWHVTPGSLGPDAPRTFAENILPACGGLLDLRVVYTWKRSQIFGFLDSVLATPAPYGVNPADQSELAQIVQKIRSLSLPNGAEFNSPNLQTPQLYLGH
ncbi:hypothetical protein CBS147326_4263 [Penicillium roqueforti]|nr:hypothetical protein CBS147326_4263 [Penicillium roqueforti]KAI3300109.1 hypothetical protein DTO002I6_832 [Penicillium roqueforti]